MNGLPSRRAAVQRAHLFAGNDVGVGG
jgi:hypothetical protein